MTIALATRNRQGGVESTHSGASGLLHRLVFGAGCSFPPPRDSIRNATLIPVLVACRLCQGGVSGPSSPDGALATAVLISPPAHVRAEQQLKRLAVFPRAVLRRSGNVQEVSRQRALAGSS